MGCGDGIVVEHTPRRWWVRILPGAGLLSSFSSFNFFSPSLPTFLHQCSALDKVPQGGESPTVCCERNRKKAELPGAKLAQ